MVAGAGNKTDIQACLRKTSDRNPPLASARHRRRPMSFHLQASRISAALGSDKASSWLLRSWLEPAYDPDLDLELRLLLLVRLMAAGVWRPLTEGDGDCAGGSPRRRGLSMAGSITA